MRFSVENLAFAYGGRRVFEEISFTLEAGEVLCLLGPNGAGKSTLIKCLAGIFVPGAGEIRIDGASIRTMRRKEFARRVAYIPQSAAPVFPFPVRDIAAMGRTPHKAFFDQPDHRDYEMVRAALAELGIEHLEYKNCTELSGGERPMVLFAAAMVQEPELLLLDEPTSHLDFGNQMRVLKTVKKLSAERGISVIMATHAPEQAFLAGSLAAMLKGGTISAWGAPSEVITEKSVSECFGVRVKVVDIDRERNIKGCMALME